MKKLSQRLVKKYTDAKIRDMVRSARKKKKSKNSHGGRRAGSGQPRKTPTSTVSFRVEERALSTAQAKYPSVLKNGKRNPNSLNAQVNNFIISLSLGNEHEDSSAYYP